MSTETLIEQLREIVENWEIRAEAYRGDATPTFFELAECIDDLKGILPPEEE